MTMKPIAIRKHRTPDVTALEVAQTLHRQAKCAFLFSVVLMTCATIAVVWTTGSLDKQLFSLGAFTVTVLTAHYLRKTKINCQELICRLAAQSQ
jgi:hypothetical protein